MKVVVANAKQFGQQFAITIRTGGHVLFFLFWYRVGNFDDFF